MLHKHAGGSPSQMRTQLGGRVSAAHTHEGLFGLDMRLCKP
jgi:hypothetical protein